MIRASKYRIVTVGLRSMMPVVHPRWAVDESAVIVRN